ncbi:MAG: cobalt transporter ATP-binding protein, partial [Paenibacillus sp.]|nr:cobalt transporter ATP-binding protein [Paenibacillus sp.]
MKSKVIMEAESLTYRYPGAHAPALQGLSMRIPEGKKTAICGHNGSGKSTFFLHAIGIHRPTDGGLKWKGSALSYHWHELQQLRQRIGLVFQDPEQQLILSTPYEDIS